MLDKYNINFEYNTPERKKSFKNKKRATAFIWQPFLITLKQLLCATKICKFFTFQSQSASNRNFFLYQAK